MIYTPLLSLTSPLLFLSSLMCISSSNWILAWISLEVNLLSFVPMMSKNKSSMETEASITYFLAQSIGSIILLLSGVGLLSMNNHDLMIMLLSTSMMIKVGLAPAHTWFTQIMPALSWMNCLILVTWQKLAPLCMLLMTLNLTSKLNHLIMIVAGFSALTGGCLGMNQTRLRSIMAFSSITHLGWIMAASISSIGLSITYFALYSLMVIPMFIFFSETNMKSSNQMNTNPMFHITSFMVFSVNMMSLAGLPPLTGFLPKWLVIMNLASINMFMLTLILLGSFMNLYFYLNIVFSCIVSWSANLNKYPKYSYNWSLPSMLAFSSVGLIPMFIYAMTLFN